jgi:hypothetical protein
MNSSVPPVTEKPPARNALYRSRIEIFRILQALAKNQSSIIAEVGRNRTFASHILLVNLRKGFFVISFCSNKFLNSKALALPAVKFTASHQDGHVEFNASGPVETRLNGRPAIRFALPQVLILYHRRDQPLIPANANASLRCIANAGGYISFESHLVDVSHDGLGTLLYDSEIKLDSPTVLKGCRIITHSGKAVIADLLIRKISLITLPDGTAANRADLRFIQRPDEIVELVNFFIDDLDKKVK